MHRSNIFRTIMSLILTLAILMSSCISAFATGSTEPVTIVDGIDTTTGNPVTIIDGDVTVNSSVNWDNYAVTIKNTEGADDTSLEITGNVSETVVTERSYAESNALRVSVADDTSAIVDVGGDVSSVAAAPVGNSEYSTGIYGETSGEDSALIIRVEGDISSETKSDRNGSTGVRLENKGGEITLNADGSVYSDSDGIIVSAQPNQEYTYFNDINEIADYIDNAQQVTVYENGSKSGVYEDGNGTRVYFSLNPDGSLNYASKTVTTENSGLTNVYVDGDVEGSVQANANAEDNDIIITVGDDVTGNINADAKKQDDNIAVIVGGDVGGGITGQANAENSSVGIVVDGDASGQVKASSVEDSTADISIGGSVENEGKYNYGTLYAVSASTSNGATNVQIAGDASVINQSEYYGSATGVNAQTYGADSELTVTVGGDIYSETASENYDSGINSVNKGGSITIDIGGDVDAEGTGIYARSEKESSQKRLNNESDVVEYKDKAKLIETYSDGRKLYTYEDESDIDLYYYINSDGSFDYGYLTKYTNNPGETVIKVAGDVNGDISASVGNIDNDISIVVDGNVDGGIGASASADKGDINIVVGGNTGVINATAYAEESKIIVKTGGSAAGNIYASAQNKNTEVEIDVRKDVNGMVKASSDEGDAVDVIIGESIVYEGNRDNYGTLYAVSASASNGTTNVQIQEDVSVKNQAENSGYATGIYAQTHGADSELTVAVGGGIHSETTSEKYASSGINTVNRGGTITIDVGENVDTEGTGIVAKSEKLSSVKYINKEEDIQEYKDKATLNATYSDGRKYYTYVDDNGTDLYYYINPDGTFSYGYLTKNTSNPGQTIITVTEEVNGNISASVEDIDNDISIAVGGDVDGNINAKTRADKGNVNITVGGSTRDISAEALADENEINIKVDGNAAGYIIASAGAKNTDVEIDVKKDAKGQVTALSGKGSTADVKIGGSIENEGIYNYEDQYAVNASASNGTTNVQVAGDATVINQEEAYAPVTGINARTNGADSELIITVGGDIYSETISENYGSTGINSVNKGGTITIDVDGKIDAESTGINAKSERQSSEKYLNKEEDIADYKDKATLVGTYSSGTKYYRYNDEETNLYYYINPDGSFDYGYLTTYSSNPGKTIITVAEDVDGNISAVAAAKDNDIAIKVGGNATGNVSASATAKDTEVEIDIKKDTKGQVSASAGEGSIADVSIDGMVTNEGLLNFDAAYGVNASALNGTTSVQIAGDVSVTNQMNYGNATGINAQTNGVDSKLAVAIDGSLISKTTNEEYGSTGIHSVNRGGIIEIDVAEDVNAESAGIYAWSESIWNADLARYVSNPGKTRITVGGDLTGDLRGFAYGEGMEVDVSVAGSVTGDVEVCASGYEKGANANVTVLGDIDGQVSAASSMGGITNFTTDGSVADEVEYWGGWQSVSALQSEMYGGETNINIAGDVSITAKELSTEYDETEEDPWLEIYGIDASLYEEESELNIDVSGDLNAKGGTSTTGVRLMNRGGKASINVDGDITSSRYGISVDNEGLESSEYLSEENLEPIKDLFTLESEWDEEDEEGNVYHYVSYSYVDEEGTYYWYETVDGSYIYGNSSRVDYYDAENNVFVGGDVIVETDDFSGNGVHIWNQNEKGESNVVVAGDLKVTGNGTGYYNGAVIDIVNGKGSLEIGGDVSVSTDEGHLIGVSANGSSEGSEAEVFIGGGIYAEGTPDRVEYKDEDGNVLYTYGSDIVALSMNSADKASLDVTVLDGISANALGEYNDQATAVEIMNFNSDANLFVNGDITSTGTALSVDTYCYEESSKDGSTDVEVIGDVTGDTTGLLLWNAENTNILIDGTLSGGDSAIVVKEEAITDSMKLTVWEIKPNDEGRFAETTVTDNDGNQETIEREDVYDQIQYIIRVDPTQQDLITTEGTWNEDGYEVAGENDTVTLKVAIPKGYRLNGATGTVAKDVSLVKDAEGNYYLIVPRGGGVFLSLDLRRIGVTVTINPNGGVVENNTEMYDVHQYYGNSYKLPTPDEREGFEFAGWYKTDISPDDPKWKEPTEEDKLLEAGERYYLTKRVYFTAIWEVK